MTDLRLRDAEPADAYALWLWANDPDARAAARDRPAIPWSDHVTWLAGQLRSPHAHVWIAELAASQPAGTIRFDTSDGWVSARLSYAVASESRGRGLGRDIVAAGVERLRHLRPAVRIWADVRETNDRSARVFNGLAWRCERPSPGSMRFWMGED